MPPATWSESDIQASRSSVPKDKSPVLAGTQNLVVVFEAGDCRLNVIDAERWEVLHRFSTGAERLSAAQASPDGRYLYVGTQSGWVTQYDLRHLAVSAAVRVGLTLRHLALSRDGRFLAAANDAPMNLVLLTSDLHPVKQIRTSTLDGKQTSRIAALRDAPPRKSFVAALQDVAELWEVSYDEGAAPIFDGYVHDYRMGEAIAKPGFLNVRRTPLDEALTKFSFDAGHHNILGTLGRADNEAASTTTVQVINLDARRKIAELAIPGQPYLSGGTRLVWGGRTVFAVPNLAKNEIEVIDLRSWKQVKTIAMPGRGKSVSDHAKSRYAWADSSLTPSAQDTLTLIDKQTLDPAVTLREAGQTLGQVQFTQDGRHVLVVAEGADGALLVFDAQTLQEIKRLPMKQAEWSFPMPTRQASP